MALVKTELNDRLAHLQERMADLTKENSVKTSEIKRLETEMRNTKNALCIAKKTHSHEFHMIHSI